MGGHAPPTPLSPLRGYPAGVRGIFKVKKLSPAFLNFRNFAEFCAHNQFTISGSEKVSRLERQKVNQRAFRERKCNRDPSR